MYPLFAKVHRFVKEFREATGSPEAFLNIEKMIMNTPQSRDRLAKVGERLARFKEFATKNEASSAS